MKFKQATDRVGKLGLTHEEIAEALGVGVQSVRQARLEPDATSFRNPPPGWFDALLDLVRDRAKDLTRLADQMERERAEHVDASSPARSHPRRLR